MTTRMRILFTGMLIAFGACNLPPSNDNGIPLIGAALQYQVTLDGQISPSDERSETDFIDMEWGLGIPPGSPFVNARVWAKNDDTWLYLLYRIEWPSATDGSDGAQIARYWGNYVPPWDFSDLGYVGYDGSSWDAYDWDDTQWYSDTDAAGQNNVEGDSTHDGTYYWFEMRKELCSADGYDWCFVSGETYRFLAGLWDNSISEEYHADIQIKVY